MKGDHTCRHFGAPCAVDLKRLNLQEPIDLVFNPAPSRIYQPITAFVLVFTFGEAHCRNDFTFEDYVFYSPRRQSDAEPNESPVNVDETVVTACTRIELPVVHIYALLISFKKAGLVDMPSTAATAASDGRF